MKDFQARLKTKDFKLNLLLEVTKAINSNISVPLLLKMLEDTLRNKLSIGKAVLFGHYDSWKCLLHYGSGNEHEKIDVQRDLLQVRDIGTIRFGDAGLSSAFEIVIPVFHKERPLAFLLLGDVEEQELQLSAAIKHLPFVQTLTNIIIVAIENKKLFKENLQRAAMAKELEMASEMQHMLFPESLPDDDLVSAAAVYLPHHQVGGDYYDFIWINEDEFLLCMGDVSGKGISAALLMSNFQANLHALLAFQTDLSQLVAQLNKKVLQAAKGEKFITVFLAKYHIPTKTLQYLNAGHHSPLLYSGNEFYWLDSHCPGLGMIEDLQTTASTSMTLNASALLLCYTDGVVELENKLGVPFGATQLMELICANTAVRPKTLNQQIVLKLEQHKGSLSYPDDVTLMTCRMF